MEPPGELTFAEDLYRTVAVSAELQQAVKEAWLRRVSAGGFVRFPPVDPSLRPTDQDVVRAQPESRIFYLEGIPGTLSCSANGYLLRLPSGKGFEELIDELNTGSPKRIGDLLQRYGSNSPQHAARPAEKAVLVTLRVLLSWRAIFIEDSSLED